MPRETNSWMGQVLKRLNQSEVPTGTSDDKAQDLPDIETTADSIPRVDPREIRAAWGEAMSYLDKADSRLSSKLTAFSDQDKEHPWIATLTAASNQYGNVIQRFVAIKPSTATERQLGAMVDILNITDDLDQAIDQIAEGKVTEEMAENFQNYIFELANRIFLFKI